MERPDYLPKNLDKETKEWLKTYGYTLNSNDERYKKIKRNLKKYYTYEYYRYVDLDIKREAEEYAENYHCVYENRKHYYQTWSKRFKKERDRLARKVATLKKEFSR